MFVENYRRENAESIMAGGEASPIPYPRITDEDWRVWNVFLPVRSLQFDRAAATNLTLKANSLELAGVPYAVTTEIERASQYFDRVEVWRKREIDKDPIAVGLVGEDRYLIARWGMDKLIPFEAIKQTMPLVLAWKYATGPVGIVTGLASLVFLAWGFLL